MPEEKQFKSTDSDKLSEALASSEMPVEKEIDLNLLFPEEEANLNVLFPDSEIRSLLKKVRKNRADIKKMTGGFQENLPDNSNSIQDLAQEKSV